MSCNEQADCATLLHGAVDSGHRRQVHDAGPDASGGGALAAPAPVQWQKSVRPLHSWYQSSHTDHRWLPYLCQGVLCHTTCCAPVNSQFGFQGVSSSWARCWGTWLCMLLSWFFGVSTMYTAFIIMLSDTFCIRHCIPRYPRSISLVAVAGPDLHM